MRLNPPLRHWAGQRVWLIGASSGIGYALAHRLHASGASVVVSARSEAPLQAFVREHPQSSCCPMDVCDLSSVALRARQILAGGPVDLVVYCAGHYRPMRADDLDLDDMIRHVEVNHVGALRVLNAVVPHMLSRGSGHISLVSSVAGYRGLPRSLAYGPTKAALINLAESLYFDLHPRGLGVSVINPGFVETPLTAGNDFPMPALISPDTAAQAILEGWASGGFEIHFPKRFTRVMKGLQRLPYGLFFPLVRRFTGL